MDTDEYLYHLVRYIQLNPVKAGLVKHLKDWEFSSYPEYAGLRAGTLPKLDVVQQQFPAEAAYQAFLHPNDDFHLSPMPQAFTTSLKSLMLDE